jgi:hypothetical protein
MACHICGQEAVARCYTCGQLFCEKHGDRDCERCSTAFAPGDRRADHISASRLGNGGRPAWWRPQEAEDFEPPACYDCGGLARLICRNCNSLYCREHAGSRGLCAACDRSSWMGLYILLGMLAFLAILVLLG